MQHITWYNLKSHYLYLSIWLQSTPKAMAHNLSIQTSTKWL